MPPDQQPVPRLRQTVLDCPNPRALAEFYRQLLGLRYRAGDEPPPAGEADTAGQDWLVLVDDEGARRLAFQASPGLPAATWPDGPVPQMLHLDMTVSSIEQLDAVHRRALELGAVPLADRTDDPDEPLWVYADPAGHPFCVFMS